MRYTIHWNGWQRLMETLQTQHHLVYLKPLAQYWLEE